MNEIVLKNPITNRIIDAINRSKNKLNFAVPFLNSFTKTILNKDNTKHIIDKRIITRFDEKCLISFDLPTLKFLLDLGFEIYYNNDIHLKLYITDAETFVTSSNLTQGGFENNVELTIKVDSENSLQCSKIFNEIWNSANKNVVNYELITNNWSKYEILKKREQYATKKRSHSIQIISNISDINIDEIITEIFSIPRNDNRIKELAFKANKGRENFKTKLRQGFKKELFYLPPHHEGRRNNLFYDLSYGDEESIASTGLRELQFKTVFEHDLLKNVIEYIFPEMVGMSPWNFEDKSELLEFCEGLFDYKIPQYSEALPIRLASYFYPEYFLPIFNLGHLNKICEALKIDTDAKTNGERLYAYTSLINEKMKPLPYDNNIKSHIAYNVMYTVELHNRLKKGESFEDIRASYKQLWKKGYVDFGLKILKKINLKESAS